MYVSYIYINVHVCVYTCNCVIVYVCVCMYVYMYICNYETREILTIDVLHERRENGQCNLCDFDFAQCIGRYQMLSCKLLILILIIDI